MSDLVGNPEDRFSHNEDHFVQALAVPRYGEVTFDLQGWKMTGTGQALTQRRATKRLLTFQVGPLSYFCKLKAKSNFTLYMYTTFLGNYE